LTISVVLADANILFSRTLRDYVLYAADEGAIEVHWIRQILAEMSRNLRENLGLSHDSTSRLEQLMNDYIEYALVEVDPGHLAVVEAVQVDDKDRHVLAAALSAEADILLTDNTKDFPAQWMAGQGIELLTAGQLLVRLADGFPDKMRAAHEKTVRYSPKAEADILATLEVIAGKYAADAIRKVAVVSAHPGTLLSKDS
jgi:predicted nucleic acid-binding protein